MVEDEPIQSEALVQESVELLTRALPIEASDPVTGIADEVVIAPNLEGLLTRPDITYVYLRRDDKLAALSLAMPIGVMDPSREAESEETAYIYITGVDPSYQGEGLVVPLMADLMHKLREAGYSFVERDSLIKNGYADKVEKAYNSAIVEKYDHNRFPEIGPERFFRIDLSKVQ